MRELGQLGRRLLAAFVIVALAAVAMVTVAALIGSQRGIAASTAREEVTETVAATAAEAYAAAGGWSTADLGPTVEFAQNQGLRVQVRDEAGRPLLSGGPGGGYEQPVVVGGSQVGTVNVGFGGTPAQAGRGIAWRWILTAAAVALLVAVVAAWLVSRWITRPIDQLTQAAAAFAGGDREARAHIDAPGEIGDLARTFDHAADTITRQEEIRRNLSADVAHELRTPLTALMAGLEEVRDGFVPADEQTLTRLHDQALRLQRAVSDLAALADAEAAPQADLRRVDLAEVVARSANAHAAHLRAAGVDLAVDASDPLWVQADPDRLDHIVSNLLSNAARYCRAGDTVRVSAYADGDRRVLDVTDTGPGISAEDLPHVFERFWRADVSSGGSGLGLAIVQELARSQGATVQAISDGHSGLTIQVSLPASG